MASGEQSSFTEVCLSAGFLIRQKTDQPVTLNLTQQSLDIIWSSRPDCSKFVSHEDIIGASVERQAKLNEVLLEVFACPLGRKRLLHLRNRDRKPYRKRKKFTFVVDVNSSAEKSFSIAELWRSAIIRASRGLPMDKDAFGQLPTRRQFLLYLNPVSGQGRTEKLFRQTVYPVFEEACVDVSLVITTGPRFAEKHIRTADLSGVDCIVSLSGDGLLSEILNGLMSRIDWREALKIPLYPLPAGSGNGLSASLLHAADEQEGLLQGLYVLLKGRPIPFDVFSLTTVDRRMFGFLSLAWGMISDVDIESEKLRKLGIARFSIGFLQCFARMRQYRARLAYLPPGNEPACPCDPDTVPSEMSSVGVGYDSWMAGKEKDILASPLLQSVGNEVLPATWKIVDDSFVMAGLIPVSHIAETMNVFPNAGLDDGLFHLIFATKEISRLELFGVFVALAEGVMKTPGRYLGVEYVQATAFRLEPAPADGHLALDGEHIEYGSIKGQVHRGLARVIARRPLLDSAEVEPCCVDVYVNDRKTGTANSQKIYRLLESGFFLFLAAVLCHYSATLLGGDTTSLLLWIFICAVFGVFL